MNEILKMILAFVGGLVLGILFFGGLWLTVKKAVTVKVPALWFSLSFLLRVGITLLGFYYISMGKWQQMLFCLVGFILARLIIIRLTKADEIKQEQLKKEVGHEA